MRKHLNKIGKHTNRARLARQIIKTHTSSRSPLDIPGVDTGITREDILDSIHAGRERDVSDGLTKWDAADHLITDEDMEMYLEAAYAENDLELISAALKDVARAKRMAEQTELKNRSIIKIHPGRIIPIMREIINRLHIKEGEMVKIYLENQRIGIIPVKQIRKKLSRNIGGKL